MVFQVGLSLHLANTLSSMETPALYQLLRPDKFQSLRDCYKEWPCKNSSDTRLWNHETGRTLRKGIYNLENQSKTEKIPWLLTTNS